jgi:hypothetical protein
MNSKGIQPKVGMVYQRYGYNPREITGIGPCRMSSGRTPIHTCVGRYTTTVQDFVNGELIDFPGSGEYEIIWSEEIRDKWLEAAHLLRTKRGYLVNEIAQSVLYNNKSACHNDLLYSVAGYEGARENAAQICESLAYDGSPCR